MMKAKKALALVLCTVLLLMPMQALAAVDETVEAARQMALDIIDMAISVSVDKQEKYSTVVWNEINTEYNQAKSKILKEEDTVEIEGITGDFATVISELGEMKINKIPKGTSLASVKKIYVDKVKSMYKSLDKKDYPDYCWDQIDEAYHLGISGIRSARNFAGVARAYVKASEKMFDQMTMEDLSERRETYTGALEGYIADEFKASDYPASVWKNINAAYNKGIKRLTATPDMEEMVIIFYDTVEELEKYAKVSYRKHIELLDIFCNEKIDALDLYVNNMDMSLYSEVGEESIDMIQEMAEDEMYDAYSRREIQAIYREAIAKIKQVKTVKQEVAELRKEAKRTLNEYLKNPKYNQKKVKPIVKKGLKALSKCRTAEAVEKTLDKYLTKAEKTVYKFQIKSSAGKGGTITKSKKVAYGDNAKFKITPKKGYKISGVWVDGKSVGARKSYTFKKVKKKHVIRATFRKKQ